MLGLRYDTEDAPPHGGAHGGSDQRDEAYAASVELAREKGAFPLFDPERYLAAPRCVARRGCPTGLSAISAATAPITFFIAPTGTISLAFADNASNGIEPAFVDLSARRAHAGRLR